MESFKEDIGKRFDEIISKLTSTDIRTRTKCMPNHIEQLKAIHLLYEALDFCLPANYRAKNGSRIENDSGIMLCKIPYLEGFIDNISPLIGRQQWDVANCILRGSYRPSILTLRHMLEMAMFVYAALLDKRILTGNQEDADKAMSFYEFVRFVMENDERLFVKRLNKWIDDKGKHDQNIIVAKNRISFGAVTDLLNTMVKIKPEGLAKLQYHHEIKASIKDIVYKDAPQFERFLKYYHHINFENYEVKSDNETNIINIIDPSRTVQFEFQLKDPPSLKISGIESIDAQFKDGFLILRYAFNGDKAIRHLNSRLSRHGHSILFRRFMIISNYDDDEEADREFPNFCSERFHNTLDFVKQANEMIVSILILAAFTDLSYYSPSRAFDHLIEFRKITSESLEFLGFKDLHALLAKLIHESDMEKIRKDRARVKREEAKFYNGEYECSECFSQHYPDQLQRGECDSHDHRDLYFTKEIFDW